MRNSVQVSESWGGEQTSRPWSSVPTTDDRCEMCGAVKTSAGSDSGKDRPLTVALWRLAQINAESPMVMQVLLRRILYMAGGTNSTLESIAEDVLRAREAANGLTRQAIYEHCKSAARKWPELKYLLNPDA